MAVFASCARWADDASRADSDGRQLDGSVAGAGGHAQSERLADQGGRELLHALERELHRRLISRLASHMARPRALRRTTLTHVQLAARRASSRRDAAKLGAPLASELRREKAIMGVFDEGCMGMFNAIIPDHLLHRHRRVQGAAQPVGSLLRNHSSPARRRRGRCTIGCMERGMKFHLGTDHASDLTDEQILLQCKMYIAAVRMADDFGCDLDRHPVSAGAEGSAARQ